MHLPLRLIAARATYFLCFAKESKQRKATPTCRFAARTSLTAHPFFGACELAALCASSDKRTLVSEKRMLRSAERRGEAVASNVADRLGNLKSTLSNKKPFGRTPSGFVFQAAFGSASKGGATLGCRGLPLLVVGGETPALAKDKACFEAA